MTWLHVIGMIDNTPNSLSSEALEAIERADTVITARRHFDAFPNLKADHIAWPSPFSQAIDLLKTHRGKHIAVISTGDPLWYSVGTLIAQSFPSEDIKFYPQISSFQLAASRMQWSLQDITCETIHGRPISRLAPLLGDQQKLLLLAHDHTSPKALANYLTDNSFGASEITALSHIGSERENHISETAKSWQHQVEDFHVLALTCNADKKTETLEHSKPISLGRMPGLENDMFDHDGQMTKRDVRAITLSKLRPMPGELLWDIGCGVGSVAIEWMRAAPRTQAIGIDKRSDRLQKARKNADKLGAPGLQLIEGDVSQIFLQKTPPHAIFFGGGISHKHIESAIERLNPHGRIVCNAVTIETEQILARCYQTHGGMLNRVALYDLIPVGEYHGWKPTMPITQWSFTK
ncbi:MAG: precorrin-6y C5,15-methyltransferase (decarboxylating) subunit CbiE [Pseudomonadota bacterium]